MAHTQVLKIERGEGTLPVGTLNKVARALGLVLSDLVREEDREARERAEHLVQMAAIMQRRKELGAQEHALYIAQERWLEARARLYAEERQLGIAQPLHSHLEETETWRSPDVVPALVGAGGW